jgi:hypothetical protein
VEIVDEVFAEDARLTLSGPVAALDSVRGKLSDLTAGRAEFGDPQQSD